MLWRLNFIEGDLCNGGLNCIWCKRYWLKEEEEKAMCALYAARGWDFSVVETTVFAFWSVLSSLGLMEILMVAGSQQRSLLDEASQHCNMRTHWL